MALLFELPVIPSCTLTDAVNVADALICACSGPGGPCRGGAAV